MSELIHCPIDGCDFAGETEQSVRGHVSGKKDDSHSGYTYDELTGLLDSGGSESSTTDSGSPTFPSAPDSEDSGCPDCGSADYYTPSQVREAGLTAEELDEYDRICSGCGELYNE